MQLAGVVVFVKKGNELERQRSGRWGDMLGMDILVSILTMAVGLFSLQTQMTEFLED